jgi:hypothetical protein
MVNLITKYWCDLYKSYTDFLPYRDGYYRLLGEDDPADPAPFGISIDQTVLPILRRLI